MNNFAVLNLTHLPTPQNLYLYCTTNHPCHLTCYYTDKQPGRHKTSRRERGIDLPWGAYFCFVAWKEAEQIEAGDTLIHTFFFPSWVFCQRKWFAFRGTIATVLSPSVSPIFEYHHPGPPPYLTEEQTFSDRRSTIGQGYGWGQKLPINNRVLSKLSFYLRRDGFPNGEIWYSIRRVLDDSLIWSKKLMNSIDISTTADWYELDIDPPISINEEVRILVLATGTDPLGLISIWISGIDVKPGEHCFFRSAAGIYTEHYNWDFMYRYTYQLY